MSVSHNLLYFYSNNDIQQIDDNLDTIEIEANKLGFKILEPDNSEYQIVRDLIIEFIKDQGRIVYGGSAYHKIIQHYRNDKNSDNTIYPEWERYDVEFYSPNPIRDLVIICNKLQEIGIKYVMGRQAQHDETFTVFANFLQYCDISFMPKKIFDNINFLEIDGIKYIHPEIILIDIFRMYNDPLTSYWRLKKVFKRMKLLLQKYPFDFNNVEIKNILVPNYDNQKIINFIVPQLIEQFDKFIFVGELAYLVYTNPDNTFNTNENLSQIEIISDNINKISKIITNLTYKWAHDNNKLDNYHDLFHIKYFSRFFQFWDKRIVIYFMNKPIFTILGTNGRCIPFIKSNILLSNKNIEIKVGTYLVTFNYYFIAFYYESIMKLGFYYADRYFINSLLKVRNDYLQKNNKTVLDSTIYKEFVIACVGSTKEFSREFMLRMAEKRANGQKTLMTYDPNFNKGSFLEYDFDQSDGLELL